MVSVEYRGHVQLWIVVRADGYELRSFRTRRAAQRFANRLNGEITRKIAPSRAARTVYTVGHSTRTLEDFAAVLRAAGVGVLVDVRSAPGSRRYPHFGEAALRESMLERGVTYARVPDLGGFRRAPGGELNAGWQNASFRRYADHMQTGEFAAGIAALEGIAAAGPAAFMCAEAQWWRCHRRMISDALVARGWEVVHLGLGAARRHELTPFAAVDGERLTYPAAPVSDVTTLLAP